MTFFLLHKIKWWRSFKTKNHTKKIYTFLFFSESLVSAWPRAKEQVYTPKNFLILVGLCMTDDIAKLLWYEIDIELLFLAGLPTKLYQHIISYFLKLILKIKKKKPFIRVKPGSLKIYDTPYFKFYEYWPHFPQT